MTTLLPNPSAKTTSVRSPLIGMMRSADVTVDVAAVLSVTVAGKAPGGPAKVSSARVAGAPLQPRQGVLSPCRPTGALSGALP